MHEDFEYSQRNPALAAGEAILWRGKPKRSAFIATKKGFMEVFLLFYL